MRVLILCLSLMAAALAAQAGFAQDMGQVVSPILTIDREALFERSRFGQRVSDDLEAESQSLSEETRKIEQSLEDEEKALTEERASLTAEEFRAAADAFDAKVVQLRSDRDTAQSDFVKRYENAQREFYNRIGPVLGQIMQRRGAVVLVDKRSVLLAANAIDVTEDAIAMIDSTFGEGEDLLQRGETDPAPDAPAAPTDANPAPQPD